MTKPDFNPCACLGPINGAPHCPCAMKQLGLPRNPEPRQKSVAEALADAFKRSDEVAKMIVRNRP